MAPRLPSFVPGDVVTLKGQTQAMTVSPPPSGAAVQHLDGWIWVVHSTQMGTNFHLLPIVTLRKKAAR